MALEPIGDIADVSLTSEQEIMAWSTEADWHDAVDSPGMVADPIADHAGAATAADGYHYGSLTRGLAGYWAFDEGSGSTAGDATELGNDGTINGATWNGSGQVGSDSLSFDGTDDYVSIGAIPDGYTNFTASVWVNSNVTGEDKTILIFRDTSDSTGQLFYDASGFNSGNSNCLTCVIADSSDTTSIAETEGSLHTTSWQHITVVWEASSGFKVYVDGSEVTLGYEASGASEVSLTDTSVAKAGLGYWDGLVDDIRFYDRALSQQEITALANLTATSAVNAGDTI